MQHAKSYITSERIEEALGHLYNEIQSLERKVRELEDEIDDLKNR